MNHLLPAVAILSTASYVMLAARQCGVHRGKLFLWFFGIATLLTALAFRVINPLSDRLVTLYWREVPLNENLNSIELSFLAILWFVISIGVGSLATQLVMRAHTQNSEQSEQHIHMRGSAVIVVAFSILLCALLAWQFAKTHAPNVDLFEHLYRSVDASTVSQTTYTVIIVASSIACIVGLALVVYGYYQMTGFSTHNGEEKEGKKAGKRGRGSF